MASLGDCTYPFLAHTAWLIHLDEESVGWNGCVLKMTELFLAKVEPRWMVAKMSEGDIAEAWG
ncbi:MAG: hypothetical protein ACXW3Z_17325 [Limisphaerales bacterium]